MSVRILTADSGEQVLYDSVTMTAFGVVHEKNDFELEDFLTWMPFDVRGCSKSELNDFYYKWLKEVQDELKKEVAELENSDNEAAWV